jgi:hypothetical protein
MRDWSRVMKGMRKADDNFRKTFRSKLRKDLTAIKKEQSDIARDLPHVPGELKSVMSRAIALEVREKSSKARTSNKPFKLIRIRLRSSQLQKMHGGVGTQTWPRPQALLGMAKKTNKGLWRHMAWGNREIWYDQTTTEKWFDQPFKDAEPKIVADVNQQLKEWKAKFGFRGFGF